MKNLKVPYITIIGNHDYRSNGSVVYKKMFGPTNFTFNIGNYHFIGFDDVVWENNNTVPNFRWLNANLLDTSSLAEVVFAHIPPWTDQLALSIDEANQSITRKPDHAIVIHGHEHNYGYKQIDAHHIIVGAVNRRTMVLVGLCDTVFVSRCIKF